MNNVSAPPHDPSPADDLASLRFHLQRVISAVTESPDLSLEDLIKALRAITCAAACIEKLRHLKE